MSDEENNCDDEADGDELESNEKSQAEPSKFKLALNSEELPLLPIQYEAPVPLNPPKDKGEDKVKDIESE